MSSRKAPAGASAPPRFSSAAIEPAPDVRPAAEDVSRPAALLDIRDLRVEYLTPGKGPAGAVRAVDGVSFAIAPGEVFGLAGESGSGKSTIAHAIMRVLRPPAVITGGQVLLKGEDVLKMNDEQLEAFRWRDVSMVFQSAMNSLSPVMRVGDQIADVLVTHLNLSWPKAYERA